MTANSTIPSPNNPEQNGESVANDFLFWSLLIPILLGCLGMIIALYVIQQDGGSDLKDLPNTDLRHIPPELIGYRQTSMSVCPVKGTPACFAVQNDSVFIVGTAEPHALYFFDEKGTLLRKIDLDEEPKAIVCGTAETIFSDKIVIAHPKWISIYDAQGNFEDIFKGWDLPQEKYAVITDHGFLPDPPSSWKRHIYLGDAMVVYNLKKTSIHSLVLTSNYLFAADSGDRRIYRFCEHGRDDFEFVGSDLLRGLVTDLSENDFTFRDADVFSGFVVYASPITMAFSSKDNLLYISNPGKHRVEVFTQDGLHKPALSWGEPSGEVSGFAGCCNPIGLAVLNDGRVLTVEKAVSRIKIYGKERKLDCVIAGASFLEETPPKLGRKASQPGGRYFSAAELPNKRIVVFDFDYAVLRFFVPLNMH